MPHTKGRGPRKETKHTHHVRGRGGGRVPHTKGRIKKPNQTHTHHVYEGGVEGGRDHAYGLQVVHQRLREPLVRVRSLDVCRQ